MHDDAAASRRETGRRHLAALDPGGPALVEERYQDLAPDMTRFIYEFAYGEVYSRPQLAPPDRQLITVATLAALGNAEKQLRFHLGAALNVGCSPAALADVMYHAGVFGGFPTMLNGLATLNLVCQRHNVTVTPPEQACDRDKDRTTRGTETLAATSGAAGAAELESLREFCPELADFVRDFAYGEIFARGVLAPPQRAYVCVAACAAKGAQPAQLAVQLAAALNVGCTIEALKELLLQLTVYAGFPAAINGMRTLQTVVTERS